MLKRYLEPRHIDLDSGRSCLALEREYRQALEVLSLEESINNGDSESRSVQLVMDSLANKYPTWRNDDRRIRNALIVVQRQLSSGH